MLTGTILSMIQSIKANSRERQPRTGKEKMLDLLDCDRKGRPTTRPEIDPRVVERIKAEIRKEAEREKRRERIIAWVVIVLVVSPTVCFLFRGC